jgi:hypothetical protein
MNQLRRSGWAKASPLAKQCIILAVVATSTMGSGKNLSRSDLGATAPLNLDTYFAINGVGYFHRPKDTEDLKHRWGLIHELGVKWDRSDFWWSEIEPRPGRWSFAMADKGMAMFRQNGVQMFPILDYGAKWNDTRAPVTDQELNEWSEYVKRVLSRYSGYADTYEVWNEPNILPFWRPQPDSRQYARLLLKTAAAARTANPKVKLVGFACADFDSEFIRRTLELTGTDCFDIASYHFYRTSVPEKRTLDEVAEFQLLLRHFGKECPIWVTETGVTSYFKEGVSEDLQAIRWMRQLLLLISAGVDRVFPFTLVDNLGDPGGEWGLQLGMVRRDGTKKPVFFAYKTMIRELQDYHFAGRISLRDNVYCLMFTGRPGTPAAGKNKLVAWSAGDSTDLKIPYDTDVSSSDTRYVTLLGESRDLEWSGNIGRVMVSASPIYVPVKSAWFTRNASTHWSQNPVMISPGNSGENFIELPDRADIAGEITYDPPPHWTVTKKQNLIEMSVPRDADTGWYSLRASIPYSSGTVQKELRIRVQSAVAFEVRPVITTSSQSMTIHTLVHDVNLSTDESWRLEALPAIPGLSLPSGRIGKSSHYFAEAFTTVTRAQLASITETTRVDAITGHGSSMRQKPVFQFAVTPILKRKVSIDGSLAEFKSVPAIKLGLREQQQRGSASTQQDCSAILKVAWSSEGLVVAADITDDHPMMNDSGSGANVYKGDSLELYIGPSGYYGQYYANPQHGAYHFALSPGKSGKGAVVSDFSGTVAGSRIKVSPRPGGYTMEAEIPASALGGYSAHREDVIAFDAQINDRDDYSPGAETKAFMWNGDDMNWLRAGKWGMAIVK